jgi:small multidrug resistance family-3 protein
MISIVAYIGCFAFWAWLRLGKSILWLVPGAAALVLLPIC